MPLGEEEGAKARDSWHRDQRVRAKSTIQWALLPYNPARNEGVAILMMIHLNILATAFEEQLDEIIRIHGQEFERAQVRDEHNEGSKQRLYRLILAATGAYVLPLLAKCATILKSAWSSDAWMPFVRVTGKTRRATNTVFRTVVRMGGSVAVRLGGRLRRAPYTEFLRHPLVSEERYRERGRQYLSGCQKVRGSSAAVFPAMIYEADQDGRKKKDAEATQELEKCIQSQGGLRPSPRSQKFKWAPPWGADL